MADWKSVPWQLRHEDEIWTEDDRYICSCTNPDYPENSSIATYLVEIHNAQINMIENSIGYPDMGTLSEEVHVP